MSTRVIRCRCGACAKVFALTGKMLDEARQALCPDCGRRMTVIEVEPESEPELPEVKKPPAIEVCVITERCTEIARGLVLAALGEET